MVVKGFVQKHRVVVEILQDNERSTDEILANYFLKGMTKELKNAVASIDIASSFDTLVNAVACVACLNLGPKQGKTLSLKKS